MVKISMNLSATIFRSSSDVLLRVWQGFYTMATENKVPKILQKIGTHNGVFHCDEALACYMLKQLPEYADAEIVRTRDQNILSTCDVVVDVGGTYNPKTHRYDHHQMGFEETLSSIRPDLAKNKTIKLSSAGLVYAHFGPLIIQQILDHHKITIPANALEHIFLYVYEGFMEEIDGVDNGIPIYPEGKARYRITTDLSSRVRKLLPSWNAIERPSFDELFKDAMRLTGAEFREKVVEAATVWWPARQAVRSAIESRKLVDTSGEILLLQKSCPWKEHIYSLEEEFEIKDVIKFVLFPDEPLWRVQAVPIQPGSYICRVFLHKNWRGVREEQLSQVSGIAGSVFVHGTGFIGGNKTKDGALKMAQASLKAPSNAQE